jgi:hypothetical protein
VNEDLSTVEQPEADWEYQQILDRERALYEALTECQNKGVSFENLKILQRETGSQWDPERNHG